MLMSKRHQTNKPMWELASEVTADLSSGDLFGRRCPRFAELNLRSYCSDLWRAHDKALSG